jgi:hypothetical protein
MTGEGSARGPLIRQLTGTKRVVPTSTVPVAASWGRVGTWAGAAAAVLVVIVTVLVALGYFDKFRGPRIHVTFEPSEPWCRYGPLKADWKSVWIRVGVENRGASPACGCVGRLIAVTTDGVLRRDVGPSTANRARARTPCSTSTITATMRLSASTPGASPSASGRRR